MIEALSRTTIFKQSVFIDNQIALEQQSLYRAINHDDAEEVKYMKHLLDHEQALKPHPVHLNGFCVLAYAAESRADYDSNFCRVMVDFFTGLKIENLYLLTTIKNNWKEYIFENKEKKKKLLAIVNDQTDGVGFALQMNDLPEILPLFFYAHPDFPHINLVSANRDVPVTMFLCKDGNFHTLFDVVIYEQLKTAAAGAGLIMGSYEVCQFYKNNK